MKLERWPHLQQDAWPFLRKVSSAVTGRDVEVVPGGYPAATRIYPKDYMSRVLLPASFTKAGSERLLNGSLAHELLHVLGSDPKPLSGIRFSVYQICNGLEDARLEVQLSSSWPGLIGPIRALTLQLLQFRRRSRAMAQSIEAGKLFEVSLSLYLRLVRVSEPVIRETVQSMAHEVAGEVFPIAQQVLAAETTSETVAIAEEICKALERAAEAVAKRRGTAAARSWTSSFKTELKRANERTVEEVLLYVEKKQYPGIWFGPFGRGCGGLNFYSTAWKWEGGQPDPVRALSVGEIRRALMEADPLLEKWIVRPRLSQGRLALSSNALVEAAVGRGGRRAFERTEHTKRMLLPSILQGIEVFVFLEAHPRYDRSEWLFLKALCASLGRLLTLVGSPMFVVRASATTRTKEWVEVNSGTSKRRIERWSKDHYVEISTLKAPDEVWDESAERLLATLPQKGFNVPLETYSRMKSWSLELPKTHRARFYLIIGKAEYLNVISGHLRYATEPIRGRRQRAVYVHVGDPIPEYDARLTELRSSFDLFLQATSLRQTLVRLLYRIVVEVAKQAR
jgi:hypothetical protein